MMDELHMPHLVCVSMLLQNVYPRIQYLWGDWNLIEQPLKCARKNDRNMYYIIFYFLQDANPLSYANW